MDSDEERHKSSWWTEVASEQQRTPLFAPSQKSLTALYPKLPLSHSSESLPHLVPSQEESWVTLASYSWEIFTLSKASVRPNGPWCD